MTKDFHIDDRTQGEVDDDNKFELREENDNKNLSGGKLAGGNPSRRRVLQDYYATHPDSTKALLKVEEIIYPALEPACGEGHISKLLDERQVISNDLIDRGYKYCKGGVDFLYNQNKYSYSRINTVITNPPFKYFQEFVEKALKIATKKVIMFGKLQALEGIKRATFLETTPLKTVYVFKKRQQPMRNGQEFDDNGKKLSSTMAFAWYVWEIGYKGSPIIKWL